MFKQIKNKSRRNFSNYVEKEESHKFWLCSPFSACSTPKFPTKKKKTNYKHKTESIKKLRKKKIKEFKYSKIIIKKLNPIKDSYKIFK